MTELSKWLLLFSVYSGAGESGASEEGRSERKIPVADPEHLKGTDVKDRTDKQLKESGDFVLLKELTEQLQDFKEGNTSDKEKSETDKFDKDLASKILSIQLDRAGITDPEKIDSTIDKLLEKNEITGEKATELKKRFT